MGSLAPTPKIAIVGGGPSGLSLAALLESKGVTDYVVYERSGPEVIPRGACLDLHPGSGQKVFKDIGAFDEMKAVGRWGKATVHYFTNHLLERLFEFGDGRDAPEVDRYDIRRILLSHIPKEKVRFSSGVKASYRDDDGKIVLELATGEKASGFSVVVGADGAFSKIRHLVTPAELIYTGHTIVTTTVTPSNPHYARTHEVLTEANMGICGFGNVVWSAPQGKGIFQLDLVIPVPDTFPEGFDIDLTDSEANKKFFLQDQYFGNFSPDLKEIIQKSEGAWRPWRLYHMPVDSFNWPCQGDVTLIGDAAHATTPWVGDGVNCSMRDALILSRTLAEFGATNEAVAQYEKEMFPWAHDLIKRCVVAGELFLEKDNPRRLVEFFRQNMTDLVGGTDHV